MILPATMSGETALAIADEIVAKARAVVDADPNLPPEVRRHAHAMIDLALTTFLLQIAPPGGTS